MALRPDYAGAGYGGNPQYWQGPRGASGGQGGGNQGWVWWDRNWVPFDPAKHKGMPVFQYPVNVPPDSTPYYANDVSSALMQQAFPGAAAGYGFSSSKLEPMRQRNILQMLNMQTPEGANNMADAYQKAATQGAYGQARQAGVSLYGSGGGGRRFQASNLLASQNRANEAAASYRTAVTDPMAMAARRQQIIEGGYNNPLADQIRGWMPGLEAQRQNNNFWGQLAGVGSQILPFIKMGGAGGSVGGGRGGGNQGSGYTWWGQRV